MSAPNKPADFRNALPEDGKSVCEKLSGMTDLFTRMRQQFAWRFGNDGHINAEGWGKDLCDLTCIKGPGGGGECPEITLTVSVVQKHQELILTLTGQAMTAGYDWEIFRSEDGEEPWTSIETGTTADPTPSVFTYTDTGADLVDGHLVDDTTYFYKAVVQKAGCEAYELQFHSAPLLCTPMGDLKLTLSAQTSAISIRLDGIPEAEAGYTVEVYRSESSEEIGTNITADLVEAEGWDLAGKRYIYQDVSDLTVGTRYYYTVQVQQNVSCPVYTLKANVLPYEEPPSAPRLTGTMLNTQARIQIFNTVGFATFRIYQRFGLSEWILYETVANGGEGMAVLLPRSQFMYYVTGITPSGAESSHSNIIIAYS